MNCPDCRAPIRYGASFCERCGAQINPYAVRPDQTPPRGISRRNAWLIVAIVVIVLAVQFVPSLVLFFLVNGFPGEETPSSQAPVASLAKSTVTNGTKITITSITQEVPWSDVSILLTAYNGSIQWYPQTYDLQGSGPVVHYYEAYPLDSIEVSLTVRDIQGDGQISSGDYLTLNSADGLTMGTWYYFSISYEPTGDTMGSISFTG